jgi:hypothetical protein
MTDSFDFPTAWDVQRRGGLQHDKACSSVRHKAFLCDCGAVRDEYERLRAEAHKTGDCPCPSCEDWRVRDARAARCIYGNPDCKRCNPDE